MHNVFNVYIYIYIYKNLLGKSRKAVNHYFVNNFVKTHRASYEVSIRLI